MAECKIITDLLPTYCDELTSWETNTFIRTHLKHCPSCCRLLEKMKNDREESKQAEVRQEKFRAAVAGYERNHRIRRAMTVLACVLLIAAFFVLRAFSFEIAIATSELNPDYLQVVQEPVMDDSGQFFQIVFSRTGDGDGALARLTKNALGFWQMDVVERATPDRPYGVAQITWSEVITSFYGSEICMTHVYHTVYAGTNANGSFEQLPYGELPGNVTVFATQNHNNYYLHVITVLPDGGKPFEILPLLKSCHLIS